MGWRAFGGDVARGLEIHAGKTATDVICSAKQIPAPRHTTSADGDPGFVQLGETGKPKLLRTSQDSFVAPGS